MNIDSKIKSLKQDLIRQRLSLEELFQKYIIDGDTYFFSSIIQDIELEYKIRTIISNALGVHINQVKIVGSGKLGFSLNPKNLFNPFDNLFNQTNLKKDKSDLDIAVISPDLFNFIGKSLFEFTNSYRDKWEFNEYYDLETAKRFDVPICFKFFEYYTKGWFRVDFKPIGFDFCEEENFEQLKQKVQSKTGRKLGLGIYQDWYYFKYYHMNNLIYLKSKVKTDII